MVQPSLASTVPVPGTARPARALSKEARRLKRRPCGRIIGGMRWIRQIAWVLLLSGCASGLNRPIVTARAEPDAQGVQRVVVHMHSFYFEPNRIEVRANH